MSRRWIVLILVLAALTAAGVAFGLWHRNARTAPEPLRFAGTIETHDVQVGSLTGGRVRSVQVDEGTSVQGGQVLVTLETDLIDRQITGQKSRVTETLAAWERTRAGFRIEEVAAARAESENATREEQRLKRLLDAGIVSRETYDEASTRARTALEAYRVRQRGNRPEDVRAAHAALEREQAAVAYLERQREESIVRAPVAGVLESIDLRPGDLVSPNQPVATILEPDQLWVRIFVPETKLGRVHVGQRAVVRVDSFPKRDFAGRVVEIRTQAEYTPRNVQTLDQRQLQVFGVKVHVDPALELKPGMAALVDLIAEPGAR